MRHDLVFHCGDWEIDLALRELRVRGMMVPLGGRAFEILGTLASASGQLVTKDELFQQVWPGAIVEDNTLQVHISAIRKALGSDRALLKTVSGRGYRLQGSWDAWDRSVEARQPASRPEATVTQNYVTNMPASASALIGREEAVERLRSLVTAYRVVTLTGPGGIGKTVLASEVARMLFPALECDVLLVELASLATGDLVPSAVAAALNLPLGDEISPQSVARALGDRKTFFVLDNCEHVIDVAAATVETVVRLCPNTTVLATSREELGIDGEIVFPVPPLEAPATDFDAAETLLGHSAVQLFVARLRSRWSGFLPNQTTLSVVATICRRLDGMPLAIEFAAARAATLGVQGVAAHLDNRFALLTRGRRTALPRHQTLRATLDWSYELLLDEERSLLRRLAVFPGGFTLAAVTAVSDETEADVAQAISGLVSKSLVTLDRSETTQRWRLLETVRAYALEKLAGTVEHAAMLRRHAEFFLTLFAPFAVASQQRVAMNELERYRREIDNLRAALTWAFSTGGDHALGVALAATATEYWVAMSLVAESCEWAGKALAHIDDASASHKELVLQCGLGIALIYTQGSNVRARMALDRALALAKELEDFDYQQRAICGLWLFCARSMALEEALAFGREYDEIAQGRGIQAQATAAWLIGVPQTYLAEHAEANERLEWACNHYPAGRRERDTIRFASDPTTSALSHNTVNLLSQGLLDAATRTALQSIDAARGTNQPTVLCVALAWAAGFVFLSLDDLETADRLSAELTDHAYKHGLRPFHAAGMCVRGSVAGKRGAPEIAIETLTAGVADMLDARYLLFYPYFLVELAEALGAVGRFDAASSQIDVALNFAEDTRCYWLMPEILRVKGELLALRNAEATAHVESLFRQSMRLARSHKAAFWEFTAATSFAEHLRDSQHLDEARANLSSAYGRLIGGASAPRMRRGKALLDRIS